MENQKPTIFTKANISKFLQNAPHEDAEIVTEIQEEKPKTPTRIYSVETATPSEIAEAEKGVRNADKLESPTLGRIVYHNHKKIKNKNGNGHKPNFIPHHLGLHEAKNQGYDSFASWNPLKSSFSIESDNKEAINNLAEEIMELSPDTVIDSPLDKKGSVLYGTFKNLQEDKFKMILEGVDSIDIKIQDLLQEKKELLNQKKQKEEIIEEIKKEIQEKYQ